MRESPKHHLKLRDGRVLSFDRTAILAILNVTPDSFSDGGRYLSPDCAVRRAAELIEQGADMLDIGGESTRPGFKTVDVQEEMGRVLPALTAIRQAFPQIPISIDTRKPAVADAAFTHGATLLNDVTALQFGGTEMAQVLKKHQAGAILMHNRAIPEGEPFLPTLLDQLKERLDWCMKQTGLDAEMFALDPGIGFGKTQRQNLLCIREIPQLRSLGCPIVLGHSRKSFLDALLSRNVDQRLAGTVAASAIAAFLGVDILRIHDVPENRDAARLGNSLLTTQVPS